MTPRRWPAAWPSQRAGLRLAGAGLLTATGAIHLDLYLTGYRSIPTLGWLFLLQVITAFGLAAAVLATGSRLIAAAGAGFALATLGGYLLSVWIGLFGFKEIRTTAGIVAGVIEVAAFAALAALAAAPARQAQQAVQAAPGSRLAARLQAGILGAGPPLAVRPRHRHQVHLLRDLRRLLAAGDRHPLGGPGRHRHARNDQPVRRNDPGHLQRAPAVHLRRRHRPRPGLRQQPQPQRRALARSDRLRLSHGPDVRVLTGRAGPGPLAVLATCCPRGPSRARSADDPGMRAERRPRKSERSSPSDRRQVLAGEPPGAGISIRVAAHPKGRQACDCPRGSVPLRLQLVTPFPAAGSTRRGWPPAAGRSRRDPRPLPRTSATRSPRAIPRHPASGRRSVPPARLSIASGVSIAPSFQLLAALVIGEPRDREVLAVWRNPPGQAASSGATRSGRRTPR